MKFLSLCSGIEAASVAWSPLGWSPVAFAEIEKFPSAVLAHHYPETPNLGDITRFRSWPDFNADVLVGGTPCQSFSVAGLRNGLADPRGNLALTYLAIADRYRPEWLVWENVPGVLSSGDGRDFGAFLGGLAELGYGFAYRVLDAQYVRVDGFQRAVPQRRRRVFVVGNSRDWRRAAAVLLEPESLSGNPAPRREAGERAAGTIDAGTHPGSYSGQDAYQDKLIAFGGNNCSGPVDVSTALQAHAGPMGRMDFASETFVVPPIAKTLTRGAESAGKGGYAGRRQEDDDNPVATVVPTHDAVGTLCAEDSPHGGRGLTGLQTMLSGYIQPVAFAQNQRDELRQMSVAGALAAEPGMKQQTYLSTGWAVRRLTPKECERLQGFPDGYTDIKDTTPDGPRYKALGNSMAVNVMRWIGTRIEMVNGL